jgi:hypothetical protein
MYSTDVGKNKMIDKKSLKIPKGLLAIVLSVFLSYTDSDYPFGIFKLFLSIILFFPTPVEYIFQSLE